MAGISEGALITDPTFIREQWSSSNADAGFPESLPPAVGSVVSINGTPGPVVDFSGGTTGLAFSSGATPITLSGVLVEADGGTHQSTYTKGDLLATPGGAVLNKLAVGANGTILTADSASTNGIKWAAAVTPVTAGDLTATFLFMGG